jgi:hypothetical protein
MYIAFCLFRFTSHLCLIISYAGIQGNGSTSCLQMEAVVFVVILPMSKTDFLANEKLYIASVASTADVNSENVKILSIDEISTRSASSGRLLMAVSVNVQTSILIASGQHSNINDQTLLNSNLNKNGLPSGRLIMQSAYLAIATPAATASSVFVTNTTPAPKSGCSDGELPPLTLKGGSALTLPPSQALSAFLSSSFPLYSSHPL